MNVKKGQLVELTICDLAFGGAGVGKIKMEDGRDFVVFVEGGVPGDKIAVRIFKAKKQYAEGRIEKILVPSPERITPRCKHFGLCGGCSLQFLNYEDQLKWKEKMVKDALNKNLHADAGDNARRPASIDSTDSPIAPILGCETPWFYRNKMEYSFGTEASARTRHQIANVSRAGATGSETAPTTVPDLTLGLHPKNRFQDVFELEECFLESLKSVEIVKSVRQWARDKKIAPYNPRTNVGILRTLTVREGKNTNELLVNLITNGNTFPEASEFAEWITHLFPEITSLYHTEVTIQRGHRTVVEEHLLKGKPTITETLSITSPLGKDTLTFEILPQAFFQTNTHQTQILYEKILELAAPKNTDIVLDLFCGTGTIGMFFAKHVKRVFGIDLNEAAIVNAKENAQHNNLHNIEFLCGDSGKLLKEIPEKADILITDPPRIGVSPQKSLEMILELAPPKWIYVSCNPTTLARDLGLIMQTGKYKISKVQPVDMFPHTYHVETITVLEKVTA